ncbi:hypothetical protein [Microbacterium sp. NPDC096154]|uniref:hypothetical protein n=1 Tax=Microbacterium sp. NPDC096154 TaxID=3155549 RepID=UPI00332B4E6E
MPRAATPLPESLRDRAFRRDEAREVSTGRLRGADLWAPARGLRLPAGRTRPEDILGARALLLPDGAAYSHTTAAHLLGVPMPYTDDGVGTIHITTPRGTRARRGKGVVGHQRVLEPHDIAIVRGVPCTRLFRTFCDLADVLTTAQLVAAGDWIIGRGGTGVTSRRLVDALDAASMPPARRMRLRRAIELLDSAAESPKESELRVILREAGFGPFRSQLVVFDEQGRFVARSDLGLPEVKVVIEYEGDHHRDRRQWRQDLQRRRRLEALGWAYIPVTQEDLDHPARLFDDLRAAIRRIGR